MKVSYPGFAGGDRTDIELPAVQKKMLEALHATGKPVVLVLTTGSALGVSWAQENLPAIVLAWYPGQQGGNAVADVLFGDTNPAGRLPVTFYESVSQLPPFADYAMEGRTYRYFRGEPLYPFGHGLSYTRFEYSGLRLSRTRLGPLDRLEVSLDVKNAGARDGDEVVQLYARDVETRKGAPIRQLRGFERIRLEGRRGAARRLHARPRARPRPLRRGPEGLRGRAGRVRDRGGRLEPRPPAADPGERGVEPRALRRPYPGSRAVLPPALWTLGFLRHGMDAAVPDGLVPAPRPPAVPRGGARAADAVWPLPHGARGEPLPARHPAPLRRGLPASRTATPSPRR